MGTKILVFLNICYFLISWRFRFKAERSRRSYQYLVCHVWYYIFHKIICHMEKIKIKTIQGVQIMQAPYETCTLPHYGLWHPANKMTKITNFDSSCPIGLKIGQRWGFLPEITHTNFSSLAWMVNKLLTCASTH